MNTPILPRLAAPGLLPLLMSLLMSACAAPPGGGAEPPLRGTVWQLGADGPDAAHIRLDAQEPRMAGWGGCNRIMGRYTLEGATLRFDGIAGTRRACLQEDGAEDRFLAALSGVRGWRIEGGVLKLLSAGGGTLLDLRPAKAVP